MTKRELPTQKKNPLLFFVLIISYVFGTEPIVFIFILLLLSKGSISPSAKCHSNSCCCILSCNDLRINIFTSRHTCLILIPFNSDKTNYIILRLSIRSGLSPGGFSVLSPGILIPIPICRLREFEFRSPTFTKFLKSMEFKNKVFFFKFCRNYV
jgi:hypothetical protein